MSGLCVVIQMPATSSEAWNWGVVQTGTDSAATVSSGAAATFQRASEQARAALSMVAAQRHRERARS